MANACDIYDARRRRPERVPLADAGAAAQAVGGFVWIDVQRPTAEELAEVTRQFGLPTLVIDEATKAHTRPKLQVHADLVLIVLKVVRYVDGDRAVDTREVAAFLGAHFVVTMGSDSPVLGQVRAQLDQEAADLLALGPLAVLLLTSSLVVDGYEEVIDHINHQVDTLETDVFGPGQEDHGERIYALKREVADFRRAVVPLARGLEQLIGRNVPLLDAAPQRYVQDVLEQVLRVADGVESLDRLLTGVMHANVARVSTGQSRIALRQNADTRKISAWAAIALVPTTVTGLYGMNFDNMPELRWRYGYFVVVAVILLACAGPHRSFRRNGWL